MTFNKWEVALVLLLGAAIMFVSVDRDTPWWQHETVPVTSMPADPQPKVPLTITDEEARDLAFIVKIHRVFPNMQWKPEFRLDNGERKQIHLLTMIPQALVDYCGPTAAACTYVSIPEEIVKDINATLEPDKWVFSGSCVIFMPVRPVTHPRSWFYLLGHEYAHCVYGSWHPGIEDVDQGEGGDPEADK
jgi:hypothetical protein